MTLEKYTAVDDVGTVINPMIVEGQLHGGIVQGVGQALYRELPSMTTSRGSCCQARSWITCMPRADNLPNMTIKTHSTPCTHTPMGVKGCGEVGTIGSPAAVINAVVDALSHLGVHSRRHAGDAEPDLACHSERHDAARRRVGGGEDETFAYHRPTTLYEMSALLAAKRTAGPSPAA